MTITDQQPLGSAFSAATTAEDVVAGLDLSGKTAVVTGGYSGLGLETTRALAAAGVRVIVPARRPDVARAALKEMENCEVIPMDLTDIHSVRSACAHISDQVDALDLLMGVAGVMATPERRVGPGWEGQLTANHFGHFTLACELYPLLAAADGARVVVNSSAGHTLTGIRWYDPHFRTGYDKWLAYGQAKTANALFAVHLDTLGKRDGVRAFALHPGKIITGLQREMPLQEQIDRGWVDEHGNVVGDGFKTPSQGGRHRPVGRHVPAPRQPRRPLSGGLRRCLCFRPRNTHGRRWRPRIRHRPGRGGPALVPVSRRDRRDADQLITPLSSHDAVLVDELAGAQKLVGRDPLPPVIIPADGDQRERRRPPCPFIPAVKAVHSAGLNTSAGPVGFLESRTPTSPASSQAASTQSPSPPLYDDLNHSAPDRPMVIAHISLLFS